MTSRRTYFSLAVTFCKRQIPNVVGPWGLSVIAMQNKIWPSRRALLAGLVAVPAAQFATGATITDDAKLIGLGRTFDTLAAEIDHAIERGLDIAMDVLEQLGDVSTEILTIQAKTIDGLSVKARVVCWALLGDLGSANDTTLDKSMPLSIVRDLIHLHDPSLEHPGALRKLVMENEAGAGRA
jgi:hypothetical protein